MHTRTGADGFEFGEGEALSTKLPADHGEPGLNTAGHTSERLLSADSSCAHISCAGTCGMHTRMHTCARARTCAAGSGE